MDQAEPFRKLEQAFRQHITDENEKLLARWDSAGQAWHFEGSHLSERTFKTLAREGGFHSANDPSQDAWMHWLDELRRNQIAPVGSSWWAESNQNSIESDGPSGGDEIQLGEPLPTVLDKLFSTSALVCLEWATEISSRMRMFEKLAVVTSDDPAASAEIDAPEETNEPIPSVSDEGWGWGRFIYQPLSGNQSLRDPEVIDLIEDALSFGLRRQAVRFWVRARQFKNLKDTKAALYEEACQDKSEYYRWERGELPDGSQADKDIRRVLRSIAD